MEFADEDAVDEWIIKNQLGKRNLTEPQYKYLRGLYYHKRQGTLGGDRKSNPQKKDLKSEGFDKTSQVVAKELGVSPNAVEQAGAYAHGLDRAAAVDPDFKTEVLTGKTNAKMKDIAAIRKLDSDEEVKAAIEEIRNPSVQKVTSRTSGSKDQRIFHERLNAISAEMEKPKGGYTLDDALRDLNSAEDVFINQIEFILRARKSVLDADERAKEALIGYIESVIHDLEEMKGRF